MQYSDKKCAICGKDYSPNSAHQKYCKDCAPERSDSRKYGRWLIRQFPERKKTYSQRYYNKDYKKKRENFNNTRKGKRHIVQDIWGKLGGVKADFKLAEDKAMDFLSEDGFEKIKNINYFKHNHFDLKAEKEGNIYVFQVTTRTHVSDLQRHRMFAEDLGLIYRIIFVKPDLSGYILTTKGEISMRMLKEELKEVRRYGNIIDIIADDKMSTARVSF